MEKYWFLGGGGNVELVVTRFNINGTLDQDFGNRGIVVLNTTGAGDSASCIDLMPSGEIVYGATSYDTAAPPYYGSLVYWGVINSDGGRSSIGSRAISISQSRHYDKCADIVILDNRKVLLLATSRADERNDDGDFSLVLFHDNGNLDVSFGNNGIVTTKLEYGDVIAEKLVVQGDGKILVSGSVRNGKNYDFAVARYSPSGELDETFGTNGVVITKAGERDDVGKSISLQTGGKILLAGYTTKESHTDIALARYKSDGGIDTGFDAINILNGRPTFAENATAVVLDSDVQVFDTELAAGGNYASATLILARHGGANAADQFSADGNTGTQGLGGALSATGNTTVNITAVDEAASTVDLTVNTHFWKANHKAIAGVVLDATHSTGDTGSVVLAGQPQGTATLKPTKTASPEDKAKVDLLDAIAILKHIVGLTTLDNAHQQIAADFDKRTKVDLLDAIGILALYEIEWVAPLCPRRYPG